MLKPLSLRARITPSGSSKRTPTPQRKASNMGTLPGASSKAADLELSAIKGRGGCSSFPVAMHVQIVIIGTAIGQHRMVIYEPFTPQPAGGAVTVGIPFNTAPGHEVFRAAQGVHVWEKDVLEFLARYLGAASTGTPTGAYPAKPRP